MSITVPQALEGKAEKQVSIYGTYKEDSLQDDLNSWFSATRAALRFFVELDAYTSRSPSADEPSTLVVPSMVTHS